MVPVFIPFEVEQGIVSISFHSKSIKTWKIQYLNQVSFKL